MKIGIDIGGTHIAVGVVDNENEIITKKEYDWTKEEKENFLKSVEYYCKKFIKEILQEQKEPMEKIGIGFPAANIVDGIVTKYGQILNLPEIISKEFNIPTYLKNDVKCSALCEKTIGTLKKYDNCIFMTLGTGIGGAYFYKNQLVIPNIYPGFEIGHMVIEANGKVCKCGRKGCFEEYASMRVFREKIAHLFNLEKIDSFKMFEILESKEKIEEVNKIIEEYTNYVSLGLTNIINIFEPDAICIGGSFTYYATIFMDKLKQKIQENFKGRSIPDILTAKYENDSGIIGASMIECN